jgi:hypothetical protein
MFVGKAQSLPKSGAPKRCFTRLGSGLDHRLVRPTRDEHSSLSIHYRCKMFYNIGPRTSFLLASETKREKKSFEHWHLITLNIPDITSFLIKKINGWNKILLDDTNQNDTGLNANVSDRMTPRRATHARMTHCRVTHSRMTNTQRRIECLIKNNMTLWCMRLSRMTSKRTTFSWMLLSRMTLWRMPLSGTTLIRMTLSYASKQNDAE